MTKRSAFKISLLLNGFCFYKIKYVDYYMDLITFAYKTGTI